MDRHAVRTGTIADTGACQRACARPADAGVRRRDERLLGGARDRGATLRAILLLALAPALSVPNVHALESGARLAAAMHAQSAVEGEGSQSRPTPTRPPPTRPPPTHTGTHERGTDGRARVHEAAIRDERSRAALERGLDWLVREQARDTDGSFPATGLRLRGGRAVPAADGSGSFAPVAVTALSTLALMSGGSAPGRGPHGDAVARGVDWLVSRTELDARAADRGYVSLGGDSLSRMHGHGFAALTLAQAFAISPGSERGARVEAALRAAVECIEKSQGVDGGWWYEPARSVQHENSITICAVQALRGAHAAGLRVDTQTIRRAVEYVSRTQKPDGSFRYALGDEKSSVALTAAAISTLNATGTYGGRAIEDGYDWIHRRLAAREDSGDGRVEGDFVMCAFYERLYLAQAMWQNSDARVFDEWWSREMPRLLASQAPDGSWSDPRYGDCYATAMNCLVLAIPAGLLPIFQR